MGVRIHKEVARACLLEAYRRAIEDVELPQEWIDISRYLREEKAPRTYTPALGAALLARSCTDEVDPLSIKAEYGERSFSLRTLCHGTLVPVSVELGFDLYASGREPLNNQPFFRYDHYDNIERIHPRSRPYFDRLREMVSRLDHYSTDEALIALSAFMRVCIEAADRKIRKVAGSRLVESSLISLTQEYVTTGSDIPKKLQACVAAALDVIHSDVISRRINDPSRDFPGDVQVRVNGDVLLSVEVRGKRVPEAELEQFVRSVSDAGIPRAALVVDHPAHTPLDRPFLIFELEQRFSVLVNIRESVSDFLRDIFGWSGEPIVKVVMEFPGLFYRRLQEIEVHVSEIERWINLFPDDRNAL